LGFLAHNGKIVKANDEITAKRNLWKGLVVDDYFRFATIRPECELGLGCMYSSPSARFSTLHTFQAFGNSEKPPRNNGLRGALAVE
jgi:hypothetical protein